MALLSDWPIIIRIRQLLVQELPAALAGIDAADNAIPGTTTFTTPVPGSDDISAFYDEAPESGAIRVNVIPAGRRSERGFQTYGAGAGQANRDEDFAFDIIVSSTDATEDTRVYGYCTRIASACVAVMIRYPDLSVPAPLSYPALAAHVALGQIDRMPGEEDRPMDLTSLVIPGAARVRRWAS